MFPGARKSSGLISLLLFAFATRCAAGDRPAENVHREFGDSDNVSQRSEKPGLIALLLFGLATAARRAIVRPRTRSSPLAKSALLGSLPKGLPAPGAFAIFGLATRLELPAIA
jgi:hypothetical protein